MRLLIGMIVFAVLFALSWVLDIPFLRGLLAAGAGMALAFVIVEARRIRAVRRSSKT